MGERFEDAGDRSSKEEMLEGLAAKSPLLAVSRRSTVLGTFEGEDGWGGVYDRSAFFSNPYKGGVVLGFPLADSL